MNNGKKVSIAMATYNGERFLRKQLDSLFKQTILPYEVIVVDDCSKDNTIKILEEYKKNNGLIYYINDQNKGVNKTFERALKECTGDYIMFCDQDDIWFPNKIEITLNKMLEIENNKPAIVSSQCINIDANDKILTYKKKKYKDPLSLEATLIDKGFSQGCSLMINKKLISNLNTFPENRKLYDAYISFAGACIGNKYNICEPLMYYRRHDQNVMGKLEKINNHNPLKKIKSKLTNRLFPQYRLNIIKETKDEYGHMFKPEALKLSNEILNFNNSNIIKRISFIFKLKNMSFQNKFLYSITEIFYL